MAFKTIWIWQIKPYEQTKENPYFLELRETILTMGIMNPPLVRRNNGLYEVIEGKWRILAARALGIYQIQVSILEENPNEIQNNEEMKGKS